MTMIIDLQTNRAVGHPTFNKHDDNLNHKLPDKNTPWTRKKNDTPQYSPKHTNINHDPHYCDMGEKPFTGNYTLRQNKRFQSKQYADTMCGTHEQLFGEYLLYNPQLYEGVDLDSATIDYLNNYFYEYHINPVVFERRYIRSLLGATSIYNNLKAIELNDGIFSKVGNETVRHLIENHLQHTAQNGTTNDITKNTGDTTTDNSHNDMSDDTGNIKTDTTLSDTKTGTGTIKDEETNHNKRDYDMENGSKTANKIAPQRISGDGFEDQFNWNSATDIHETEGYENSITKDDGTKDNLRTLNTKDTDNGTTNETQTLNTNNHTYGTFNTIQTLNTQTAKSVLDSIDNNFSHNADDWETITNQTQPIQEIVENVWNYLIAPKAIDYLITVLSKCFISVY